MEYSLNNQRGYSLHGTHLALRILTTYLGTRAVVQLITKNLARIYSVGQSSSCHPGTRFSNLEMEVRRIGICIATCARERNELARSDGSPL